MILGVTGGLGCGKSSAAKIFKSLGYSHLDADAIIRGEILTEPRIIEAIGARFGQDVVAADGVVNRAELGSIVFSDSAALLWLENLVHPPLFARMRTLLAATPREPWVVEMPLLFEKQLENWFDFIVCVTCAPAQQLIRLEQRGLARALAAQRIAKQLPLVRKIELSDFVLLNDGSPDFLHKQIDLLVAGFPVRG